jgi:hypothetical protein
MILNDLNLNFSDDQGEYVYSLNSSTGTTGKLSLGGNNFTGLNS